MRWTVRSPSGKVFTRPAYDQLVANAWVLRTTSGPGEDTWPVFLHDLRLRGTGRVWQAAGTVDSILRPGLLERAVDAGLRSLLVRGSRPRRSTS
jgi:hypothetical protein